MKRIVLFTLFCAVAIGLGAQQSPFYGGVDQNNAVSPQEIHNLKADFAQPNNQSSTRAITTELLLDYDGADELYALDQGFDYNRFVWGINGRYIQADVQTINWVGVAFDQLIDANTAYPFTEYPLASSTVRLDSIILFLGHWNPNGNSDVITTRVQNMTRNQSTGQVSIGSTLWTDSLVVDTSLSPALQTNGLAQTVTRTLIPNPGTGIQMAQGEAFFIRIDFDGDTTSPNQFNILSGYNDPCGGACAGEPSVAPDNSFHFGNYGTFQGVNVVYADCDGNQQLTVGGCEEWYLQNHLILAFVTVEVEFNSVVSGDATEDLCPGDVATVSIAATGGVEPITYSWSPTSNVSNPFAGTADVTAGNADATYTVTIADANGDTIYETITVDVEAINVDAGTDQSIGCGATADLLATVTGTASGASFSWSNGVSTLNNDGVGPGTYTITASNSFGCSTSDAVVVSLAGVGQSLGFTIDGNDPDLTAGQACQNVAVSFTNTSSDVTNWGFTWDYGDGSGTIGTGTDAAHAFANTGTFTVTLTSDSANCELTETATVTVLSTSTSQCDTSIGINDPLLEQLISVYPNPTTGTFIVNFSDITSDDVSVNVYNMIGREIYSNATKVAGSDVQTIDISNFSNGVYLVKIQIGEDLLIKKITLNK